ncbi:SCO1/SenC-domain-containing protein [Lipomyces japonicus]|uniref:SCO1/SenC-domain-containing protein n=1 Tax=Lipomyces japonicus TaxID=56871 RepID=UPI0034CD6BED
MIMLATRVVVTERFLWRAVTMRSSARCLRHVKPTTLTLSRSFSPSIWRLQSENSGSDKKNVSNVDKEAETRKILEEVKIISKKRPVVSLSSSNDSKSSNDDDSIVISVGKVGRSGQKNTFGVFNIAAMGIFAAGLFLLVNYRRRVQRALDAFKEESESQSFGKALIGGPFQLTDYNGNLFTEEDLKHKFSLIYFGFTLCPDICPEELDKLAIIVNNLRKQGIEVQPIFISCDPLRDTPEIVKGYLEEFDIPGIIGLTGTHAEVEATCKAYRVYFSTPPDIKPGEDYIVDHSIFFYLMDKEGEFINVYGRRYDAQEATDAIASKIKNWLPARERTEIAFKKPSFFKFWE